MKKLFKKLSIFLISAIIISSIPNEPILPDNPSVGTGIAETMDEHDPNPKTDPTQKKG